MFSDTYTNLPDEMPVDEIRSRLEEILTAARGDRSISREDIGDAILQMAYRQWHSYQPLDADMKDEVERWVTETWSPASLDLVEAMIGIIGTLGLPNGIAFLRQSLVGDLPDDVRAEIENALSDQDYLASADDPWKSMRNLG